VAAVETTLGSPPLPPDLARVGRVATAVGGRAEGVVGRGWWRFFFFYQECFHRWVDLAPVKMERSLAKMIFAGTDGHL
jgi:hypothetical protein